MAKYLITSFPAIKVRVSRLHGGKKFSLTYEPLHFASDECIRRKKMIPSQTKNAGGIEIRTSPGYPHISSRTTISGQML